VRLKEFTQIDELAPKFVNKVVDKSQWKRKGSGMAATVWQHMMDPHTVVKLVGGGDAPASPNELKTAIAFVQFCVEHGHENKHFPIIHGINVDDPEVVQIRIEALFKIKDDAVGRHLAYLADSLYWGWGKNAVSNLNLHLRNSIYGKSNTAEDILVACKLLTKWAPKYQKLYKLPIDKELDLHEDNWMARADGTLVAVDPWYSGS